MTAINERMVMLEKIANELMLDAEPSDGFQEPIVSEEDVAEAQYEAELEQDQMLNPADPSELGQEELSILQQLESVDEPALEEELIAKSASELLALGTLAKLIDCSQGGEHIEEDIQKQASDILDDMSKDSASFYEGLDRTAAELFGTEENLRALYSKAGVAYTLEKIALLENDEFDKQADENDPNALSRLRMFASDAINGAKEKVQEAVHSATNLKAISAEMNAAASEIAPMDQQMLTNPSLVDAGRYTELAEGLQTLERQKKVGQGVVAGVAGLGAAGAVYGGKKLYDHTHQEEKIAEVLPEHNTGGKLYVGQENENTGGIQKMSKEKVLVNDFLKLAGAAILVGITNNEGLEDGIRKEASDAFEYIANLGQTEMGEQFIKVAQSNFSENELHEIVAGNHTESLVEKVAFFIDATEQSTGELEKIANAGGVSAVKNVGAGMRNALENIANTIGQKKNEAEAAGREYVGTLKAHPGAAAASHAATGLAGGGLVAGGLAGYNMVNNPQEYNIEQTAAAIEEAELTKQAAADAYMKADSFIAQYGHIVKK